MRLIRHFGHFFQAPRQGLGDRAWLTLWLLLSLCTAPWLARTHQVVHAPQAVVAGGQSAPSGVAFTAAPTGLAQAVLALFGHHAHLDCQALDQLAHGQAPHTAFTWQAPTWGQAPPQAQPVAAAPLQRCWRVLARGPPQGRGEG